MKILGRGGLEELKRGNKIKKRVVLLGIKLARIDDGDSLNGEFDIVNSYLNIICPIIKRYGGYIDRYSGDGLIAAFSRNENAIDCAHTISRNINIKNRQNRKFSKMTGRIAMINMEVVFGIADINGRNVPSIISNLSPLDKIDELCKFMSMNFIFTNSVIEDLPLNYRFKYRYIGGVDVLGKNMLLFEDLEVYPREIRERLCKTKGDFERGIIEYERGDYKKASMIFENTLRLFPNDRASYIYYNKSKERTV